LYGARCCAACETDARVSRAPGWLELVVRAGLASLPAVLIGGWIATQYVEERIFSLVVPSLVGLAASWAAGAAAPRRGPSARWMPLVVAGVAVVAGVLGTALGFRLVAGGRQSVLHPLNVVGAPYLCAVLGAALWPLLLGAPKPRAG
jgi:hypothetical protein